MKVLSHRGYWKSLAEKNCAAAFVRSFEKGFGTELDLRDLNRILVVSHDPPGSDVLVAHEMFEIHRRLNPNLTLALNIKSDGLQHLLSSLIHRFEVEDCFVFDMSVPDSIHWIRAEVPFFTRHSDVEEHPALYSQASGVWLDAFHSDWWDADVVSRHVSAGKRVCIVSPELHSREHRHVWDLLTKPSVPTGEQVMLCTDYPEEAAEVFRHDH